MNSSVRSFLKAQAHTLKPIVMIGKGGLDQRVIAAMDQALTSHELVKVKFQAFKDEMRPLAEDLAQKTGSSLVSIIGFIATFYRESEEHLIHIPRDLATKGD
ncbi:RNA-binding protein YhbY [bioreactor metagenome]|uniref:RNA-binding protein YhbY n=1 Tax=bioreactor metagenome TaxID=1076179 RepID=A0A645CTT2_9ZZZZ|nr:YhbY family RNA-binding protein [Sphaerochaeta sp.]